MVEIPHDVHIINKNYAEVKRHGKISDSSKVGKLYCDVMDDDSVTIGIIDQFSTSVSSPVSFIFPVLPAIGRPLHHLLLLGLRG